MNTGGEAAEQIVRMSLNGVEMAAKISGAGAKHLAILLYTILSQREKTSGKARLASMLRSGKPLKVFSVSNKDLPQFIKDAKQYGILYCALKDPHGSPDGMTDIMVRAEDAPKINRVVERFKFAVVDTASVKAEIEQSREEVAAAEQPPEKTPEQATEEQSLMDDLFGAPVSAEQGVVANDVLEDLFPQLDGDATNPTQAETEKGPPSEPSSPTPNKGTDFGERSSVRDELKEIRTQQEKKKAEVEPEKKQAAKSLQHKQPKSKKKPKKRMKGR
jgi:hypothetical protein